jgi:hypothetical protein
MKPTKNRDRTVRITARSVKKRGTAEGAFLKIEWVLSAWMADPKPGEFP